MDCLPLLRITRGGASRSHPAPRPPEDFFSARSNKYDLGYVYIKRTSTAVPTLPHSPTARTHTPHSLLLCLFHTYTRTHTHSLSLSRQPLAHTQKTLVPTTRTTQHNTTHLTMFARLFTRAPRAFNAARFNSTSSATRTSRLAEMAASAEKPSTFSLSLSLPFEN